MVIYIDIFGEMFTSTKVKGFKLWEGKLSLENTFNPMPATASAGCDWGDIYVGY